MAAKNGGLRPLSATATNTLGASKHTPAAKPAGAPEPQTAANGGLLRTLKSVFGLAKLPEQQRLEAREQRENANSPFIQYPLVTREQMRRMASHAYRLDVGHASFAHHSFSADPTVHSLSDLTDPAQLNSLLPRRRPQGSPVDTLLIKAGDDAMLVLPTVMAIADGVSGWESKGEQASLGIWARSMVETLSRLLTEYRLSHMPHVLNARDVQQVLDDSFLHTSHLMDLQGLKGSSTLLLGMLSGATLKYISIGDSRLWVVRGGRVIRSNTEQMAAPLCPQQIGTQTLGRMPSEMAEVDEVALQENDLIVMCSDGISDNLFDHELVDALHQYLAPPNSSVRVACSKILAKCKLVAYDDNAYTPYNEKVNAPPGQAAKKASLGGKMDDMSICIARVVANESAAK
ncbi:protein serine/threonine phosphatase 2C [Metschnikowia bicuspidata var. bicuspidata NRRL YB-4993]|uniref:Protein phosphatase n=1 Tax=Metschnikowia bicuspidata var. bicuspidata NRRL YB-4993 TaxID=869754 RepID=A0A1A0H257_9ASCO|nr:protein serine/threonine phosphatase 2C [Metschnikowia bicuspidata var. bicuspidata NRRL YB-4993]OBA18035.1 protein serine/threonine phosphatase 2C [Metschnikowia bicuspidata var. bicuspidata NRRL YB-4993]